MSWLKSGVRALRSSDRARDLWALANVMLADCVLLSWAGRDPAVNDVERNWLIILECTVFGIGTLVLLRLAARRVARRRPDRRGFVHRLAALSNWTVILGTFPVGVGIGSWLMLSGGIPAGGLIVLIAQLVIVFGVVLLLSVRGALRPAETGDQEPKLETPSANAHAIKPAGSLLALAACTVLSVVVGILGDALLTPYLPWAVVPIDATPGTLQAYALPDGNVLSVLPGSLIRVRYTLTRREVEIDHGTAQVETSSGNRPEKDHRAPALTVRAGAASVIVAPPNTARADVQNNFYIRKVREKTAVLVSQGNDLVLNTTSSASSASDTHTLQHLKPNDLALVTPEHTLVRGLTEAEVNARPDWLTGELAFNDTPLADAVAEVNEFSDRPFTIEDPSIASVPVTARLRVNLPNLAERFVVALERESTARRTPPQPGTDAIGLVAFNADPSRFGPVEAQVSADVCASYRGVHDLTSYVYDPLTSNPELLFNVAGCDVVTALAGFTQQSGFHFEIVSPPAASSVTHHVNGFYSVQDALATMLDGTGCHATGDTHSGLKIACTQT